MSSRSVSTDASNGEGRSGEYAHASPRVAAAKANCPATRLQSPAPATAKPIAVVACAKPAPSWIAVIGMNRICRSRSAVGMVVSPRSTSTIASTRMTSVNWGSSKNCAASGAAAKNPA